jgi:hypothetical protein
VRSPVLRCVKHGPQSAPRGLAVGELSRGTPGLIYPTVTITVSWAVEVNLPLETVSVSRCDVSRVP